MADDKSHTEQGQIERAQRIRRVIDRLKKGKPQADSSGAGKSLKEQIDERAREVDEQERTAGSK